MALFKTFQVEASNTGRDKSTLAEKIDKTVSDFLIEQKSEAESIDVHADTGPSGHGHAIVTLLYRKKEAKK